jgi:ferrous iron transport protein B
MNAPLAAVRTAALIGNPNAGKTALFNALTGLHQKVANYPGVTVERKLGSARFAGTRIDLVDLPGTYSLVPISPDERVAVAVLDGTIPDTPAPEVVVAVVDATALARGLFLVTQLLDRGLPLVVALTMSDLAAARGMVIDHAALESALGVPVIALSAPRRQGVPALLAAMLEAVPRPPVMRPWTVPDGPAPADPVLADAAARYAVIDALVAHAVRGGDQSADPAIDRVLLHPVWGMAAFLVIMGGLFTALFVAASPLMDGCQEAVSWAGTHVAGWLPHGVLRDLVRDGIFGGVGSVLVFVPQIALLFLFLAVLEDSGYLARAAFLMDRLLAQVGLHGRSFVPMLSGHACAIPGILATRTMADSRDRLATILVMPYMSCSARLPVYALVVATIGGAWAAWQKAALVTGCYLLGIAAAATAAWIGLKLRGRGARTTFLLELPAYRLPQARQVLRSVWTGSAAFVTKAGTTIFALSILIWALTAWPRPSTPDPTPEQAIAASVAGRVGRALDPVLEPMGLDGASGIGLVAAFAAREVYVSTMAIVYGVDDEGGLPARLQAERRSDGSPRWSFASGAALLVFFVLAMQCVATTAVVRRETGGWRWPLAQLAWMNAVAWLAAVVTYQGLSRWGL